MKPVTPPKWKQAVVTLAFIGLLWGSVELNKKNVRSANVPMKADPQAVERYGFKLEDVAKASGIDFVHQPPKLDPKLAPIQERVADMGAAIAVCDFDKDGWQDLYFTNSLEDSKNVLYRNLGDGKFEEVAGKLGIADVNKSGTGVSMGALWGDINNDGWDDLLVYKWGVTQLFINNQGKSFTDVTATANLPKWMNTNTASLLDYDSDGNVDILLCGYFNEKIDLWNLASTDIMPDSLEYATNGTPKHLLRNLGGGKFEDVTETVGLLKNAWTLASIAADLRGTGYPDIFLANDYGKAELWRNDGGKRFTDIGQQAVTQQPKSGMNAVMGDIYNDGRLSIQVSNIWEDNLLQQGNNVWVPKDGNKPGQLLYENQANALGLENGGWSFGAQFGDLNNDGTQDMYLVNGYISLDQKLSYWYDYAKFSVGHGTLIRKAENWPAVRGRSLSGYQQKRVWTNDGAGRFQEVGQAIGATDLYDGRAVALVDLWNRGVLDVVTANQRGPVLVYKNTVKPGRHWIKVNVTGANKVNRSAIGAMVTVHWGGMKQTQVLSAGTGFCAQNDHRLHFGLGETANVDKIEIRWPGGKLQTLVNPKVDSTVDVVESTAS